MSRDVEELNRRLLRARDAMDRAYAEPLDVRAVAAVAHVSEAHFIRTFRAVFGETPHRYLQRRRVERSMFLLRETDRSMTEICMDVGFTSLGNVQPDIPRDRRRDADGVPRRAWAHGGAQLRPARRWARPVAKAAIEQFRRSAGRAARLTSAPSNLAKEKLMKQ